MQELKERFSGGLQCIKEEKEGKTIIKFKGPFQEMSDVVGRKNRNGRAYTKSLWEKALKDPDVLDRLKSGRMLGELDHPTDDGQIRRTSHIIRNVQPDYESGIIEGELELLNHNQGDAALLRALVEQGVQICVSSRAYGDFLKDGCTIDPETFKLSTWDIVLDPSVSVARLNRVAEKLNEGLAPESQVKLFNEQKQKTDEQKLKEKRMDEKLIALMESKQVAEIAKAKAEANLDNMKTLVESKNTQIDTMSKKLDEVTRKHEELEADSEKAAKLLTEAITVNKTLKEENENLKKLGEEATTALVALTERIEKYNAIEEEAIEAIEDMKEKLEEDTKLGDKAADLIVSLTEKVKAMKKKMKRRSLKKEAIDTDGGPDALMDRPLKDRKPDGTPADKGEGKEDDEDADDLEEEDGVSDSTPAEDEAGEPRLEAKSSNMINRLFEGATGVEVKDDEPVVAKKKKDEAEDEEDNEDDKEDKEKDEE
jgi:hypothetical protein